MSRAKITSATIPYQLRPHKAIERNLFLELLKLIHSLNSFNFKEYRYIGFGAAYLEDFKILHLEFGITDMHSLEADSYAFTRQEFNNPYEFVTLMNESSSEYISTKLIEDKNKIVWLDYASPGELGQQLSDLELLAQKTSNQDVLKFTFNAQVGSFISSHNLELKETEFAEILNFLKEDPTYQIYLPSGILNKDVMDFPSLIRTMGENAIRRGLSKGKKNLNFYTLSSFQYADMQRMLTVTGIIASEEVYEDLMNKTRLSNWKFLIKKPQEKPMVIMVPAMTVLERIAIDKKLPTNDIENLANSLIFKYGSVAKEHLQLIKGYQEFYKYLPYYSKVMY